MIKITINAHHVQHIRQLEEYLTNIIKPTGIDALIEGNVISPDILMSHGVWAKDFPVISINRCAVWQATLPPEDVVKSWLTWPRNIEEAVSKILADIPLDKLKQMMADPLAKSGLTQGIRNGFGLWTGNVDLKRSCGSEDIDADDASAMIINALEKKIHEIDYQQVNKASTTQPIFVVVFGGIASGKTRFRRDKYADGFTHIDAGDIFISLCGGRYYEFPAHFEDELNYFGRDLARTAVYDRNNIVCEANASGDAMVRELAAAMKTAGYTIKVDMLKCTLEEAERRNVSRGIDNISSYYSQSYHLQWLIDAATEYALEYG